MNIDLVDSSVNYARDKDEKLKKACEDFEALFVSKMFETMRKSEIEGGLIEKSRGEEIFTSMLDSEVAQESVKGGGMGLAKMLYDSLGKYTADDKGNNFPAQEKTASAGDDIVKLRQQLSGTDVASDMSVR
ncbi:rod-binding protein [Seleniivibrio sp.]|uniref:rod-binding protein n=1 Tax=Seleniivibrio sp. TaxID=2898801 RepID=UPI0025DF9920|nr:rod-binding protein [Seleniivibrio sp.]MCD8554016.1 rod-binding protein [Seleniivibrio sp.]